MATDNDREYFIAQREKVIGMLSERRAERDERQADLEVLNQEIVQLEQLLGGIVQFVSDAPAEKPHAILTATDLESFGLADACREVLKDADNNMTARAIRDSLELSGYKLKQHANALASIHGVLKRMFESGELEQLEAGGKTFYRRKPEIIIRAEVLNRRAELSETQKRALAANERKRAEARLAIKSTSKKD